MRPSPYNRRYDALALLILLLLFGLGFYLQWPELNSVRHKSSIPTANTAIPINLPPLTIVQGGIVPLNPAAISSTAHMLAQQDWNCFTGPEISNAENMSSNPLELMWIATDGKGDIVELKYAVKYWACFDVTYYYSIKQKRMLFKCFGGGA